MTTFHDPQPLSRRAVRQSERGEMPPASVGLDTLGTQQGAQPFYPELPEPMDAWDAAARRAAQPPVAQTPVAQTPVVQPPAAAPGSPRREAAPAAGRRSSGAPTRQSGDATESNSRQSSAIPSFDGPSFRARQAPVAPREDPQPPTQALPPVDQPTYRNRDFSPEGRRAAFPAVSQPPASAPAPAAEVAPAPFVQQPAAAAPAPSRRAALAAENALEVTLSRRELRVMQQQEAVVAQAPAGLAAPAAPVASPAAPAVEPAPVAEQVAATPPPLIEPAPDLIDTLLHSGPIELPLLAPPPQPSATLAEAMAEFDALARGTQLVEPQPWAPTAPAESWSLTANDSAPQPVIDQPSAAPTATEPSGLDALFGVVATPARPVDAAPEPEPLIEPEPVASDAPSAWPFASFEDLIRAESTEASVQAAPVAPSAPAVPSALAVPIADVAASTVEPIAIPAPAPSSAPDVQAEWSPPVGHWSTQADLDEGDEPYETTINRTIGSGIATTNALVLPALPASSDITGALTSTGEIVLTGSIDLPRSFASTGSTARIEDHALDHLFDSQDHDVPTTDSAPVLATQAISTFTSAGQSITQTQKPKGNHTLTILFGSAVAMAAVAVGLLVVAVVTGVF